MLKAMRTGAQSMIVKLVLFGLLLMAMAGLALMDVQGMFRAGISDTTVAKIDGEKITAQEFERQVSQAMREKNVPQNVGVMLGIPDEVLAQQINSRIFGRAAQDIGYIADDDAARKQIQEVLAPFVKSGMTEKDALSRILAASGSTEDRLVGSVKAQLATSELLKLVPSGARAPQQLVDAVTKFQHEERRGEYFTVTAADAGKASQPSEAELKEYYKTIASRFALPEYRTIAVLVLDKKALGIEQKADEAALKKYYEDHKADYTQPETRVVSQAVAPDEDSAKAVYAEASKTKDLRKAAGAHKANYVKGEAAAEKDMPEEISAAAFKGAAGAVLPPLKTPFGWHVMYVEKVIPGAVKSFDSVRAQIVKDTSDDKSSEALYEQANKIDDLLAGGKTLEEVAQQYSLKPVLLTKVDAHGLDADRKKQGANVPALDKVLAQAFRTPKGEAGQLVEAPTGEFVVAEVREIVPSENQPFDAVRAAVLESWKQKEAADLLDKTAAKISERLKLGEPFEKIAAGFGKTPAPTGFLTRAADPGKEKLDKAYLPALFSLGKAGDATAVAGTDGIIVLRLSARRIDESKAPSKEDAASLATSLDHALQQDILDQYRAVLIRKYNVTVNDKLVKDMFKPKNEEN